MGEPRLADDAKSVAVAEETVEVLLQTTQGNIVLELYPGRTPLTVENFLQYVRDGQYDNTVVYRIESFLIQMGSKKPDLYDKPKRPPIQNEADKGLKNERYTVGMARWGRIPPTPSTTSTPRPTRISITAKRPKRVGVMSSSARWWKACTWSTRSRRFPPKKSGG